MKNILNLCVFVLFVASMVIPAQKVQASSFEKAGDILQFVVPVYALGLSMVEEGHEGTKQFAYSFASSQLAVHVLKEVSHQKRPNYREGDKKRSFPSGHAASAFGGATFIHRRYGFKQAAIPYGMAVLTGLSRIKAKKHYPRDVIAGALISGLFTFTLVDKKSTLTISPDESGAKIAYAFSF